MVGLKEKASFHFHHPCFFSGGQQNVELSGSQSEVALRSNGIPPCCVPHNQPGWQGGPWTWPRIHGDLLVVLRTCRTYLTYGVEGSEDEHDSEAVMGTASSAVFRAKRQTRDEYPTPGSPDWQ